MTKKILIVTNHFFPEQFRINDICKTLVAQGYAVDVITQIPNYPSGSFFKGYSKHEKRTELWEGVSVKRLWCIPRGNSALTLALNYLSYWFSTWRYSLKKQADYDVVLAYMTSPVFMVRAAQRIARKLGAKMVLYTLDMWPENFYAILGIGPSILTKPLDVYCTKTYMRNDVLLVSSHQFIEKIRTITKDRVGPISYLPQHGESVYTYLEKPAVFQHMDAHDLNVTFTGNVGKAQGLDFLIEVANRLKTAHVSHIKFNIVGDGSYRQTLESMVNDHQLHDYFRFLGRKPIDLISPILAESDLGLVSFSNDPIFFATLPAKVQSYLACGVPIITYARGAVNEAVAQDDVGFAVELGDIDGFVNALLTYQNYDKTTQETLSRRALDTFKNTYHSDVIIDKLIQHFEDETVQS